MDDHYVESVVRTAKKEMLFDLGQKVAKIIREDNRGVVTAQTILELIKNYGG
jgi:hypothetical protein